MSTPESQHEREPQKYFLVTNVESGLGGFGHIPIEAIQSLVGEHFPVLGFRTDEGEPAWAVIKSHDIAQSLGADGHDPNYWPAAWWSGYADAFKSTHGEIAADRGNISMPFSNGEVFEAENEDEILNFLLSRNRSKPE